MRVLVVEDEPLLADAVATGLRRAGMAVDVSSDGRDALDKIALSSYDVIVLDRDLPRVSGDEVCREVVQREARGRILMLTAAGDVADRIEGLDLGADDYLPKPFDFGELVARIRALRRRPDRLSGPSLELGDLVVNPSRLEATRAGRPLHLTQKEFGVLEELLREPGRVVSAEELLERVWDEHANPFTNTVRTTVMRLRKKLGEPELLTTVPGSGYLIGPAHE
jgi:DNA-binding response OmpR family regulator